MALCDTCGSDCSRALAELSAYTLSLRDRDFIHQHVVDAYGASHGGFQGGRANASNIGIAFSLLGLYLTFEKAFTGRQVQKAHMALAKWRKQYPPPEGSPTRASLTIFDALAAAPGPARDHAVKRWAEAVWQSWTPSHEWTRRIWQEFERDR